MVSTRVLSTVSAAMWGASHHDALVRAGRGQAPVDEPPSLAERLARVEARLDELVQLVKQAESYRLPF